MYYHVSSYVNETQKLTQKTKNNRCFCEYISNCYANNYDEYKVYFDELYHYKLKDITGKDVYKWICEAIFEGIRKRNFPDMPSRIWGIFLSNSFEKALEFRVNYRDVVKSRIFEIDVSNKVVYGFDMSLFTSADEKIRETNFSVDSYELATKLAMLYWSGKGKKEINEFIVDCPIVIGKCVN